MNPILETKQIKIGNVVIGGAAPIALITGPCQLETRDHTMFMAEAIAKACSATGTGFIFKASYDKANRSSISTQRGIGMDEGLKILAEVRDAFGCPVLTDVHDAAQCAPAGEVVDVIQKLARALRQVVFETIFGRVEKLHRDFSGAF